MLAFELTKAKLVVPSHPPILRSPLSHTAYRQCWFECLCRCHFPTATVEVVSTGIEQPVANDFVCVSAGCREGVKGTAATGVVEVPKEQTRSRKQLLSAKNEESGEGIRLSERSSDNCSGVASRRVGGSGSAKSASGTGTTNGGVETTITATTSSGGGGGGASGTVDAAEIAGEDADGNLGVALVNPNCNVKEEASPNADADADGASSPLVDANLIEEAVAAAAARGENRAASGGVSEVRSVGGIGQGGRSGCSSSSSSNKVEGEEQDGEKKREGGASSHHLISGSAMALAAACPAENVMSDGGNSCCCAASCWFACSCACHNVAASSAAVAAGQAAAGEAAAGEAAATGTGEGCADRRRDARDGCPRRKRRRNGRELSSEPHRRDNKGARVTVAAPDLDVKRAFLATSECGAGPRVVHFGKAARYSALPLFGQRGGGGGTPGAGAGAGAAGSGEVAGAKTSYDLRWAHGWVSHRGDVSCGVHHLFRH